MPSPTTLQEKPPFVCSEPASADFKPLHSLGLIQRRWAIKPHCFYAAHGLMCFYMHRKTLSSEAIISHVQLLHIYLHRGLCAVLSLSVVGTYYNSPDLAPALGDPARKCHFTVHPIFHLAYVQYRWLPTLVRTEQDPIPSLLLFNQVLICVRTFSFKSHICFSFFKCLVFFFIRNFDRSFLEVLAGNTIWSLIKWFLIPVLETHNFKKACSFTQLYHVYPDIIYCISYYSFYSFVQYSHQA